MKTFTEQEKRLVQALNTPLPAVAEPFAAVAEQAGMSLEEALDTIRKWKDAGIIRRFGARVRHHAVGYTANGMSVWAVPPEKVEAAAAAMTSMPEVSHCYLRRAFPGWRYNMYAMIHGKSEEDVRAVAAAIAAKSGITDYDVLYSHRELKKSAPVYSVI